MFSKQIHHYVYVSHIENIPLLSGHSAQCAQSGQVQSVLYHTVIPINRPVMFAF